MKKNGFTPCKLEAFRALLLPHAYPKRVFASLCHAIVAREGRFKIVELGGKHAEIRPNVGAKKPTAPITASLLPCTGGKHKGRIAEINGLLARYSYLSRTSLIQEELDARRSGNISEAEIFAAEYVELKKFTKSEIANLVNERNVLLGRA